MKKNELADQIIAAFDGEEWEMLDSGSQVIPVSSFYADTLLELMDPYSYYEGDVDDAEVQAFYDDVKAALEEKMPEDPASHKYIIYGSMIRAFLDELPMHPVSEVKYFTKITDGKQEFFCPKKESSPICSFCAAEPCGRLFREWDENASDAAAQFGERAGYVRKCILESGFQNAGVIKTADLNFFEEVRKYCRENQCHHFDATWACPPAVGTVEECRVRTCGYDYLHLFSMAFYLPDAVDWDSMKPAVKDFKKSVNMLDRKLQAHANGMMILSNDSCSLCRTCTYPDAPCRIPEHLHHSIEGYGFYVSELARQAGIPYFSGSGTITLFGAVLHNK